MRIASFEAFAILALTIGVSLARPRIGRVRIAPAAAASLGAALSLALGLVPIGLVFLSLELLFFPIVTIVCLMIITQIAERSGLFDLLSRRIAVAAKGSGRRLFTYVFAYGSLTGMLFTNDAAVLIFTPLVFQLIERVQGESWTLRSKIPFYFAVLYVANLVGALVTSNPINIVVASLFHISFLDYALWMFLPAAASILVSFTGLAIVFRKTLPRRYECRDLGEAAHDRRQLALCSAVLGAILVGFFTEGSTGVPTWLVAVAGAATLLVLHAVRGKGSTLSVLRGVGWDVLVFVTGIFVVVMGLRRAGLTREIGLLLSRLAAMGTVKMTLGTSLFAAVCSSILNNHPTADMMGWAIRDLSAPLLQTKALALAALIGGDLGPKMLPIGSLAALIWFRLLRDRGVEIPYSLYVRIGVPVTLAAILAAVFVLNLELAIAGHRLLS
ncbi:MAG: ArsB/NhaD family transporter [Thermoanaerobaculia bacterium]